MTNTMPSTTSTTTILSNAHPTSSPSSGSATEDSTPAQPSAVLILSGGSTTATSVDHTTVTAATSTLSSTIISSSASLVLSSSPLSTLSSVQISDTDRQQQQQQQQQQQSLSMLSASTVSASSLTLSADDVVTSASLGPVSPSLLLNGDSSCTSIASPIAKHLLAAGYINNNSMDSLDLKLQHHDAVSSLKTPTDMSMQSPSSSSNGLLNGGGGASTMLLGSHSSGGLGSVGNYTNDHQSHANQTQHQQQQQQQQQQSGSNGPTMWSNLDDGTSNHLNSQLNGYNNYQNFNNSPIFNGASAPNSIANLSQQNRRAITASHGGNTVPVGGGSNGGGGGGGYGQHGMSPNNSMGRSNQMMGSQQQKHSQGGGFNNNYPSWSNPPPTVNWPGNQMQQQQQQQQQQQNHGGQQNMSSWNRGRSVPNLNPMSSAMNRKPTSPNPGLSPSAYTSGGGHQQVISPVKYRRSTSFPGKIHGPGHGPCGGGGGGNGGYSGNDVSAGNMDDGSARNCGDPFMQTYHQDRNSLGNGLDMRSLEHCLSDIIRGINDGGPPDHLKGFMNCTPNSNMHGKPFYQGLDDHISEEAGVFVDGPSISMGSPARSSPQSQGSEVTERFSRKVFVGGLPPDIDEDEITSSFRRFGQLVVDWPHKAESKSYFPPKGYAFLLFQDESSVQQLIEACITDEDKLYLCVSSPTIKDKPVQIRPWRLSDADYVLDASMPLDPRKTVFVGGVPRPLKALELAMIMDRLYGGVCYAGIDTDPELKYPKGAGRVAFSNQQSYIAAISARFVQLQHGDIDKRVEVKPYVLDDQMCDECQGQRCGGKFAPFFCANVTCLQYYCDQCWGTIHSRTGREYHKPLVKEGADRPRAVPYRWC